MHEIDRKDLSCTSRSVPDARDLARLSYVSQTTSNMLLGVFIQIDAESLSFVRVSSNVLSAHLAPALGKRFSSLWY